MLQYSLNTPDSAASGRARAVWDAVAKPLRSLGKLEDIVVKIAGVQRTEDVCVRPRCVLVFCADHGVVEEGVSQCGREVTGLVAASVADGTSNVNLMAKTAGADVYAVDMGIAREIGASAIIRRRIAAGTGNMARERAMTRRQAEEAVQAGIDIVRQMQSQGYRIIVTGEMGIGNTTASAAILCALLGLEPEEAVGRGAGLSDAGLARKRAAVERALKINRPDPDDPLDVLAKVGGFEIAAMAGAFLGGMTCSVPIVIDGAISAVSALLAARICPAVRQYMIASHMSREGMAGRVMKEMDLEPVIHAGMALGEGTGGVALLPLIDMALSVYRGRHTFSALGMQAYTPQGGDR